MGKVFMLDDNEAPEVSCQNSNAGADDQTARQAAKKDKDFMSKEEIGTGLIIFFVGAALGLVIFLLSYFSLSHFKIHYIICASLAAAFSIAILIALDAAMGSKESKMKAPILAVLFIAFVFTILNGYEKQVPSVKDSGGKQYSTSSSSFKSETLVFTSTERLLTHVSFLPGSECRITVRGAAVNLVNDKDLKELTPEHGTYVFEVVDKGCVIFKGIENEDGVESTVIVEWQE